MKILVVYHGESCTDGFTSAWLATVAAKRAGYEAPELYPLTYADGQEQELQHHIVDQFIIRDHYDIIYILDISLTEQCLAVIVKTSKANIVMLDHHKTAFDRYLPDVPRTKYEKATVSLFDKQVYIGLNNGMSGAGMTHMYFFPKEEEAPLLVQHVQDRDNWSYDMKHTKAVDRYLKNQEQTIENWTDINAMMCHATGYCKVVQEGQEILDLYEAKIEEICGYAEWITILGSTGLMVRCNYEYASDVGHLLCKTSGTFGLTYSAMKREIGMPSVFRVSLRSEGDFDVEDIAKELGGGGHKNAAGFIIAQDRLFSGDLA